MEVVGLMIGIIGAIAGVTSAFIQYLDRKKSSLIESSNEEILTKPNLIHEKSVQKDTVNEISSHSSSKSPRTNLPFNQGNSFIGRQKELKKIISLLTASEIRLVTITGTAGIGKTRLAKMIALKSLNYFPGGCYFVDLIDARTEPGIAYEISKAIATPILNAQLEPKNSVVQLLKGREKLLLVLDNFEQLIKFAPANIGFWVNELTNVVFLVTSRLTLGLRSENEIRLRSLSFPEKIITSFDLEFLNSFDGIKLFYERAKQQQENFQITELNYTHVIKVCKLLSGLPLALELAAARINIFTPEQMAIRISEKLSILKDNRKDRHPRQQTLFKAIEWSYQLLNEKEKIFFLMSSMFNDGFFIEAAEEIFKGAMDDFVKLEVVDEIQMLRDHSLLNAEKANGKTRFSMYVAIQEFAREKWLSEVDELEKERFLSSWANFYLKYISDLNELISTQKCKESLDLISLELENVFGIQEWGIKKRKISLLVRIILAFSKTMEIRGPAHLRIPRINLSLQALEEAGGYSNFSSSLKVCLSKAHWATGEWEIAQRYADEAFDEAEFVKDDLLKAEALYQKATMQGNLGHKNEAVKNLINAKNLFSLCNELNGLSGVTHELGSIAERMGKYSEALELFSEAEQYAEKQNNIAQLAIINNRRGLAHWHYGFPEEAIETLRKSRSLNLEIGFQSWVGGNTTNLGLSFSDLGDYEKALELFLEADKIHIEMGNLAWAGVNYGGWARCLLMRNNDGDHDRALNLIHEAEKIIKKVGYKETYAMLLGDKGRIYLSRNEFELATLNIERAIKIEKEISADKDPRHFSNLVSIASSYFALTKYELAKFFLGEAEKLRILNNLKLDHKVLRYREDMQTFTKLQNKIS